MITFEEALQQIQERDAFVGPLEELPSWEEHWQGVYALHMQNIRMEQAKRAVEAQRRKENVDAAVEAAKMFTDAESVKRYVQRHFCALVESKRL